MATPRSIAARSLSSDDLRRFEMTLMRDG